MFHFNSDPPQILAAQTPPLAQARGKEQAVRSCSL